MDSDVQQSRRYILKYKIKQIGAGPLVERDVILE
jgi:hypothetical protein